MCAERQGILFSIGNGAGTVKTLADVAHLVKEPNVTHVTVGSVTRAKRDGNAGDTYYCSKKGRWSLNALGLPNPGFAQYVAWAQEMLDLCVVTGKVLRMSVAGFSPGEYAEMTRGFLDAGIDEVELNLSCPNVLGKPVASENPELTAQILACVKGSLRHGHAVAAKVSPIQDEGLFAEIISALRDSGIVSHIVVSNTIPRQQDVRDEDGRTALWWSERDSTQKVAFGGRGGRPLLEGNLRLVYRVRAMAPRLKIIGLGGIFEGMDIFAYWKVGASGIQCATSYLEEREALFSRLMRELSENSKAADFLNELVAA